MTPKTARALAIVQDTLADYIDLPLETLQLDTELSTLQVDSLTLAEMLFQLEDHVGGTVFDAEHIPQRIGEIVALIESRLPETPIRDAA
jgi:acyl carrier protein